MTLPVEEVQRVLRDQVIEKWREAGFQQSSRRSFVCNHCGERGAAAMRTCGGCLMHTYCSERCQKLEWPSHKTMCREMKAGMELVERMTGEPQQSRPSSWKKTKRSEQALFEWYYSVPLLPMKVMCLAWTRRHESVILRVQTFPKDGSDAMEPRVTAVPRSEWGVADGRGLDIGMKMTAHSCGVFFDAPDNNRDQKFLLFIDAVHMRGPREPGMSTSTVDFKEDMDHMVLVHAFLSATTRDEMRETLSKIPGYRQREESIEKMTAIVRRAKADRMAGRITPVRLTGLVGAAHLNGREGIAVKPKLGADDERVIVRLWPDGKEVGVKYANMELIQADDSEWVPQHA